MDRDYVDGSFGIPLAPASTLARTAASGFAEFTRGTASPDPDYGVSGEATYGCCSYCSRLLSGSPTSLLRITVVFDLVGVDLRAKIPRRA